GSGQDWDVGASCAVLPRTMSVQRQPSPVCATTMPSRPLVNPTIPVWGNRRTCVPSGPVSRLITMLTRVWGSAGAYSHVPADPRPTPRCALFRHPGPAAVVQYEVVVDVGLVAHRGDRLSLVAAAHGHRPPGEGVARADDPVEAVLRGGCQLERGGMHRKVP